jgi:hypothetical protein
VKETLQQISKILIFFQKEQTGAICRIPAAVL